MKPFVIIAILVIASTFLVHTGLIDVGLLPVEASAQSVEIDKLFGIHIWLISALFSLIMVTLLYCLIVFRRRKGETGDGVYFTGNSALEVTWTAIPLFIVLFLAFIGSKSLGVVRRIDPSAMQIKVIAGQWYWQFQYPEYGITSTDLYLPVGKQVDLVMTSNDVIHSFWVPEFRVKQDLVPGRTTELRVTPILIGNFMVRCSTLCGLRHAYMEGAVNVVSQEDFNVWVSKQQSAAPMDPALRGQQLATQYGCANCHSTDGTQKTGPTWLHLYTSNVSLSDGTTVPADENYLKTAIVNPNLQVVAGFSPNVMPNFANTLDQTMVEALVAYIETLK